MTETLWYIGGILFIALGIGLSIGLHELGHLVPAKKFGVKVPTYAIGFGPTLFKFTRGETTYAIKLIPLGGYISMIGMYPPAKPKNKAQAKSKKLEATELNSKPNNKRRFFGDMILQARQAHGEHITAADANRKFYQLPVRKRLVIMFGGPLMNLVFGSLLMVIVFSGIGTVQQSTTVAAVTDCVIVDLQTQTECTAADPASPAIIAGVKAGDKIISVNSVELASWQQLSEALKPQTVNTIVVQRDGSNLELELTPVLAKRAKIAADGTLVLDDKGQPVMVDRPVIGIALGTERKAESVISALDKSAWSVGQVGQMIVGLPQQLTEVALATFAGHERNPNGAISVVGIAQISGSIASADSVDLLGKLANGLLILASLNFALFVFNMLPLLPLDGGHIAGGLYEGAKRSIYRLLGKADPGPADTALLMPITWFVFIFLMGMSLLLIMADLINPITL